MVDLAPDREKGRKGFSTSRRVFEKFAQPHTGSLPSNQRVPFDAVRGEWFHFSRVVERRAASSMSLKAAVFKWADSTLSGKSKTSTSGSVPDHKLSKCRSLQAIFLDTRSLQSATPAAEYLYQFEIAFDMPPAPCLVRRTFEADGIAYVIFKDADLLVIDAVAIGAQCDLDVKGANGDGESRST